MEPSRMAMSRIDTSGLSARQRRILEFIARTVRERGYPPTVREIGEAVGLTSSSSVHPERWACGPTSTWFPTRRG